MTEIETVAQAVAALKKCITTKDPVMAVQQIDGLLVEALVDATGCDFDEAREALEMWYGQPE